MTKRRKAREDKFGTDRFLTKVGHYKNQPHWHGRWILSDGKPGRWSPLPEAIPVAACCYGDPKPKCVHKRRADAIAAELVPLMLKASAELPSIDDKPKREPVDYRYDAIHPNFLKLLARIAAYADEKYGSWDQYMRARLTGHKAPLNHAKEHLRAYEMGESYDHFDGDPRWHLAATAYNCMMEWYYHTRFGHAKHPSAEV